jgi:predicted transcriptional regulator
MKSVLSVRLDEQAMERLRELAKKEKKEISTVARELIDQGWVLVALREYKEGRLSLGTMAQKLGLSLSRAIDLLSELGVRSPIGYDDYLESYAAASSLVADKENRSRRSRS